MIPLYARPATALAAAVRAGEVSCREVIEAHLARIEAVDDTVGAVTVVLADAARAAADAVDARRAAEGPAALGPLGGVPFTVKENLDCLGSATTHGVRALRDARPYLDAPIVGRMRAAGAIPIARTNLSELGLRLCTDNPLRGRTRNPYDARLTVGGSSGGDAAAVATGMAPIGLGNDIGGSLRIPAHCAGVAALKPTTGRIPRASSLPPLDYGMAGQAMLADGPIARAVGDLRAALAVTAGRDVRDPRSVDAPRRGPPVDRRAGLVLDLPGGALPAAAVEAIRRAGARLEAAGWAVEVVDPPELDAVDAVWGHLLATDFAVTMPMMRPLVSEALYGHMGRVIAAFDVSGVSNHRVHVERARLGRAWSGFFAEYPVLVGPNWTRPFWPIDADLDPEAGIALLRETVRFTLPGNALGLPCVALPMGLDPEGLPTSVQIYADLWREDLCLDAAEVIEAGGPAPTPIDPGMRAGR